MPRISAQARLVYRREMDAARKADDALVRWRHLERAHIVSQPDPWLHTCNHTAMLVLAVRQRDRREALGQVLRLIVAAPRVDERSVSRRQHRPRHGRADDADAHSRRPRRSRHQQVNTATATGQAKLLSSWRCQGSVVSRSSSGRRSSASSAMRYTAATLCWRSSTIVVGTTLVG